MTSWLCPCRRPLGCWFVVSFAFLSFSACSPISGSWFPGFFFQFNVIAERDCFGARVCHLAGLVLGRLGTRFRDPILVAWGHPRGHGSSRIDTLLSGVGSLLISGALRIFVDSGSHVETFSSALEQHLCFCSLFVYPQLDFLV